MAEKYDGFLSDISRIKLVIWDLDDTFWSGTLTEEGICGIPLNASLVKKLTDKGIINSICSKNDFDPCAGVLKSMGVWEYFVFPSVNWEPKGLRIKSIIDEMQLRCVNVLFIDDNVMNLKEAEFYCEGIMTALPDIIPMLDKASDKYDKDDSSHKRLKQYRILEQKAVDRLNSSSNEEFLRSSGIKVKLCENCAEEIERIYEMIIRTNQLNFTKNRCTKDELLDMMRSNEYKCGYVTSEDRFGDYGIVGFYALFVPENRLVQFAFSCRTLGMGVEQYAYAVLGFPPLEIVGEVVSELKNGFTPDWINSAETDSSAGNDTVISSSERILIKGPCDFYQLHSCIQSSDNIDTEFTYVREDNGVIIPQRNHTMHLMQALTLSDEQKKLLIKETAPFSSDDFFSDLIYDKKYGIICLSLLVDANAGIYRRKETGECVVYGEHLYPVTDEKNWDGYISGEIYNNHAKLTREYLKSFSKKYEFVGRTTPDELYKNCVFIRDHIDKDTLLVFSLAVETPFEKNKNPVYENRHLIHREYNKVFRRIQDEYENVRIIDPNKYITSQSDFIDSINHQTRIVYYKLSKDLLQIVNSRQGAEKKLKPRLFNPKAIVLEIMQRLGLN